jgi:hypothetical protein
MASRIEYKRSPAQVMRRAVEGVRLGLEAAAREWHEDIMPVHFTVAGGRRYAYQPRSGDNEPPRLPRGKPGKYGQSTRSNPHYSWRKRREKGHNRPLVWSGDSEADARSAVKISSRKQRGTEGRVQATAVMPNLPKYFYQRRKDLNAPDKPAELTRVLAEEEQRFARTAERVAMAHMMAPTQQATVRAL